MDMLSVSGLVISTASGLLLMIVDTRDRQRRTNKQQAIANATTHLEACEKNYLEHLTKLRQINKQQGRPEDDRVEAITGSTKATAEQARADLRALTDPHQQVIDELTPMSHLFAYFLLMAGFALQLASEFTKR